ncbi:MAG: cyclic nucleotide-binding domain-containing protein [Pseudomonadota bacterium]
MPSLSMRDPKEQFDSLIRSLVPLNALPPASQTEVIRASQILSVRRGRLVFKEGDTDNYSFYLLDGTLELSAGGQLVKEVKGRAEAAKVALAQLQPRQLTAKAKVACRVLQVDRLLLDRLLSAQEASGPGDIEVEVAEIGGEESIDWMTRMLQSELFSRIPAANIQNIFARMTSVEFDAGDVVVEQGTPGDFYYVIQSGQAAVLRRASGTTQEIKLAELGEGDSFGEEALVSNAKRNATVKMITPGELMRLTKDDFIELIREPALDAVSLDDAQEEVGGGAQFLDVRFPEEQAEFTIDGAVSVPISMLRMQAEKLNRSNRYVVVCDNGIRSSAAAFLLTQLGFDVAYVRDGLSGYGVVNASAPPIERPLPETGSTETPKAASRTKPKPKPAAKPEAKPRRQAQSATARSNRAARRESSPANEAGSAEVVQAEIRANALNTQLEKAKLELERALHAKAAAETKLKSNQNSATEQVKVERELLKRQAAKANQALTAAQRLKADALDAQRQAEANALAAQRDAAERVEQIKAEREAEDRRVGEQLEDAIRQKAEAEARQRESEQEYSEQLRQERERAASESSRAAAALEEARRLKHEAEAERARAVEEVQSATQTAEQNRRLHEERETAEAAIAARLDAALKEKDAAEQRQQETETRIRQQAEAERAQLMEEVRRANDALVDAQSLKDDVAKAKAEAEAQAAEVVREREAEIARLRSQHAEADEANNARLEAALAEKREAEDARALAQAQAEARVAQEAEERRRESERAAQALQEAQQLKLQIEAAKRQAETEAEETRAAQEERIRAIESEAEKRLRDNEARLEAEYSKNAEELAALQHQRDEMEAALRKERERMEAEQREAKQSVQDARRRSEEAAEARQQLEVQVEEQRRNQESLEEKMRAELQARLSEERRKLEAEFAVSADQIERLQQEKAAAEKARLAAQAEAKRIIEERRHEFEAAQRERAAREEAEGDALERELQAKLAEVEKRVNEAENTLEDAVRERDSVASKRREHDDKRKQMANELKKLRDQVEQEAAEWATQAHSNESPNLEHTRSIKRIENSAAAALAEPGSGATPSLLDEMEAHLSR